MYIGRLLFILCVLITPPPLKAATVNVAVASNFAATLRLLATAFNRESGHQLRISSASTGKLYAQIVQGAPYDVFLAADSDRPERLVHLGLAAGDSRFTYARGRLLLWSPRSGFAGDGVEILTQGRFRHLAIANPKTAPYGVAARQALESLGLWETIEPRLVRGENIGQTFQYVASGAAELGLVSRSQLPALNAGAGYDWPVPSHLHTPIRQQAVLLARGAGNPAATDFLIFLRSDIAAALIAEAGYLVGDGGDR
jgi:molybdate transport system substrate-binding protein